MITEDILKQIQKLQREVIALSLSMKPPIDITSEAYAKDVIALKSYKFSLEVALAELERYLSN